MTSFYVAIIAFIIWLILIIENQTTFNTIMLIVTTLNLLVNIWQQTRK